MEREKIVKIKRMINTMHNTNDKCCNSNNKSTANNVENIDNNDRSNKKIRLMRAVRIE